MNTQSRALFIAILVGIVLISGCKNTYFDLELRPDGDTLHRSLSVEAGEDTLSVLEEIYGHQPVLTTGETASGTPRSTYKFQGAFRSLTPNDIGGAGFLLQCESNMGSSSVYSEQFRGDANLAAVLSRQEIAFNRLLDIFLLWLESEFGNASDFPALQKAVDENLRDDLWNLSLYLSTFSSIGNAVDTNGNDTSDVVLQGIAMRTLHFLIERGYFDVLELPDILAAISSFSGDSSGLPYHVARALANIMEVSKDDPLPESLALIVENPEAYADSVEEYFDTDEVEILTTDAFPASFKFAGLGGVFLRANMQLANEPFITNGEWDEDGVLKWRKPLPRLDTSAYDLPVLIYAFWSEPDREFQNEHFEREVLIAGSLGEYCDWRHELTEKQGEQWDEFVESLEPGEELVQQLEGFQFKGEPDRPAGVTYEKNIRSGIAQHTISNVLKELKKPPD